MNLFQIVWPAVRFTLPFSLCLLLGLITCSCQSSNKEVEAIPMEDSTHAQPNLYALAHQKATQELNLNILREEVDSFELRLWAKVEVMIYGQVLVIKKVDGKWTCLDYRYTESQKEWVNELSAEEYVTRFSIDSFSVTKREPQSNWNQFFNNMQEQQLFTLPDQRNIPNWQNRVTDGYTYHVEWATKDNYQFISYNCPDVYQNDYNECLRMTEILEVFDREFGLYIPGGFRCGR
ncbi:hypothetical protein KFE98_12370 [bacterium SCSIO 12741]|nr:hypothetical protein KFE98_12370 [bacterium SCSIO 12741]